MLIRLWGELQGDELRNLAESSGCVRGSLRLLCAATEERSSVQSFHSWPLKNKEIRKIEISKEGNWKTMTKIDTNTMQNRKIAASK